MNPYPGKYFDEPKRELPKAGSFTEQISEEGFERVRKESVAALTKQIEILDTILDGIKKGYPNDAFEIGKGEISSSFEELSEKKEYLEESMEYFDTPTFKAEVEDYIKTVTDLFALTMTMTNSRQVVKTYNEFESLIGALEKQRELLKEKKYGELVEEFSEN